MKQPQRVTITDCPHDNRHKGLTGYIHDRYADGTACIGLGFGQICIARGWQDMEPVKREDLKFNDEGIVDDSRDIGSETPQAKRRGRPKKAEVVVDGPKRRGRPKNSEFPATSAKPERYKLATNDMAGESPAEPADDAPESTKPSSNQDAQPPISVTAIEDGRVSLTCAIGSARITVECAIFPLNYAMRAWYWVLRRDRGVLDRLKPYRVEDPTTPQIEESLIARELLTGQRIGPKEAVHDALLRSNALYAVGVDQHRLDWLVKGIYTGRIKILSPLELAIEEAGTELVQKRQQAKKKNNQGGK